MKIIKSHIVVDELAFSNEEIRLFEDIKAVCEHHPNCYGCPLRVSSSLECMFARMPNEFEINNFPKEVEDVEGTDN